LQQGTVTKRFYMLIQHASILIVDDDPDVLTALRLLLRPMVKEVVVEKNPDTLRSHITKKNFDLVLLDMNFNSAIHTGNEGFFWLKEIRKVTKEMPVIMITAYADIDLAIRSLKEGAADFVVKPWQNEKLVTTIKETLKRKGQLKNVVADILQTPGDLIGDSDAMEQIKFKISKIAPTDANILILGENGTGKDLIARAIHDQSVRADKPFVKVDVGALTESLFESELFGHQKGAFTDAREDRAGRFEHANTGTLFLDEIGNIPLHLQAKLLSVLQNRQVTRLGSNQVIPVDIRLICATNVPMAELANERRFRRDLMYRINTVEIIVPPLRTRGRDVLLLAEHFRIIFSQRYRKPIEGFETKAKEKLMQYPFPGNVRELQSLIERAVILSEKNLLQSDDLIFSRLETGAEEMVSQGQTNLGQVEKNTIIKVIEKHDGNITKAAKELGLTRTALYRRLNKYDI
jgi:two-component system, NtrC family, response regulator HydG